ncbi:MAG: hypothetical protein J6112_01640 [Clostridia bacterium]|nr:hypothetical protein [Clostridia bacterium]
MKKIICLLMALAIFAALTACAGTPSENVPGNTLAPDANSTDNPGDKGNEGSSGKEETPEALKAIEDAKVGDIITFGSWDQDGKDGGEPVSWIVLCQGVGKTFVLSEKILENQCFKNPTEEDKYPTALYKDSDLRTFLNGEFYEGAFTAEEKASILTAKIKSEYKDEHFFELTYETEDKVFPLSREEAARYVCGVGTYIFGYPTQRVLDENPYILSSISDVPGVEKAASWWLRDMGTESSKTAAYVYTATYQRKNYDTKVYEKSGVRPAMWIVYNAKELEAYEKGEAQPKANEALDNAIAALKVGDKLQFGKYDKNPYNMDGYEDLMWTVLSEDDESFLLVSNDQVCSMNFAEKTPEGFKPDEASWAESNVREYINSKDFLDFMFSPQEKARLVLTHVVCSGEDDRDGGKATDDLVFIPDVKDVEDYLSSPGMGISYKYWLRSQLSWAPYIGMVYTNGTVGSADPTGSCYVRIMVRIHK